MNFDILYSIAVDLINKRSFQLNNSNSNEFVCVLVTQSNSIFTGVSSSAIQNGKLVAVCAEYETIKIMLNSNETVINALVVVNCQTKKPCVPCDACKKLILEVNPINSKCLIMKEDKSFVDLNSLINTPEIEQSIWEDGWDDSDDSNNPNLNSMNMSEFQPKYSSIAVNSLSLNSMYNPNSMSMADINSGLSNSLTSMSYNPARKSFENSSSYGVSNRTFGSNSLRMESINGGSTLQTAVVQKSNSTFAQQQARQESNNESTSRFKEMLKGIIDDEKITPVTPTPINPENAIEESNSISLDSSDFGDLIQDKRTIPTKKELKAMAKEKKKQAKRNSKILQSIEKRSRT